MQKPFPKEAELSEKMERLAELNAMLNRDEKGGENLLADEGIGENPEVNVPEERQDRIADMPMWYVTISDWTHRSILFPILQAGLPVKI